MSREGLLQAAKQALEALELERPYLGPMPTKTSKAITALRRELEKPADEPVACIRALTDQCAALVRERDELQKQVWRYEKNGVTCQTYGHKVESSCSECNVHEFYTHPQPAREWVGLTDEEIEHLMDTYDVASPDYARAIEAKLKEKNT